MALPKVNRLKRRQDFSAVYQAGLRRATRHLTLRALKLKTRPGQDHSIQETVPSQIGISISQKVSKRAVIRNRIKRQLRAALRQLLPQIVHGWHIVVVVKPEAVQCDYKDFLQELRQLLMNAEVMDGY